MKGVRGEEEEEECERSGVGGREREREEKWMEALFLRPAL